jgi:CysZ protein
MTVFSAFSRALRDLFHPRILAVLLLPMLGAIVLWSVLAWVFWDAWVSGLRAFIDGTAFGTWLAANAAWLVTSTTVVLIIALLLPATFITAVLITELVAMPIIVSVVGRRYPHLATRGGGTILHSVLNATAAVLVFALLWIVTLPLWLTGIGAVVVPALNSAYLNQRLFRYDALSEHATREEYREIVRRRKGGLYLLGLLLAMLYYVPFVNLVAPVASGLAFTHYCLAELDALRRR